MKKVLFLAMLVLIGTGSYAQKKNVKKAKNLCMVEENPKFDEARDLIQKALQDPTTKDMAETWFVAGLIGYQQNLYDYNHFSEDWNKRGNEVIESLEYWTKADEVAMTPVYNKKGKAKTEPKYRKMIAEKVAEYYQCVYGGELVQYAVAQYNVKNYEAAYNILNTYLSIPDMAMMQENKMPEKVKKDSNYYYYKSQLMIIAYQGKMYDRTIELSRELLDQPSCAVSAGQHLYQTYMDQGDVTTANQVLEDCIKRFPKEPWFLQNMINNMVRSGNTDDALAYLDQAIASDPQAQYYLSKGTLLTELKRFEEAETVMLEALRLNPEDATYNEAMGFAYFDRGNALRDQANDPKTDNKTFDRLMKEADELFKKTLPYFRKAYELKSDNAEYRTALKQLLYRLKLTKTPEYEALVNAQ